MSQCNRGYPVRGRTSGNLSALLWATLITLSHGWFGATANKTLLQLILITWQVQKQQWCPSQVSRVSLQRVCLFLQESFIDRATRHSVTIPWHSNNTRENALIMNCTINQQQTKKTLRHFLKYLTNTKQKWNENKMCIMIFISSCLNILAKSKSYSCFLMNMLSTYIEYLTYNVVHI